MESRKHNGKLKRSTYLSILLFVGFLTVFCYRLFSPPHLVTKDKTILPLTPFTAHEQKDLISAQEQEEQLDVGGPLISQMSPAEAQTRVLNLNRSRKTAS